MHDRVEKAAPVGPKRTTYVTQETWRTFSEFKATITGRKGGVRREGAVRFRAASAA